MDPVTHLRRPLKIFLFNGHQQFLAQLLNRLNLRRIFIQDSNSRRAGQLTGL